MSTILLEVATPDKGEVYKNDINMLITRSICGELGILPKHARLLTELIPHAMRIKEGGGETQLFIRKKLQSSRTRRRLPTISTLNEQRQLTNAQRNVSPLTRAHPKITRTLTLTERRRHLPEQRHDFWLKAFPFPEKVLRKKIFPLQIAGDFF